MTNAEAIETLRVNYPDACYEQLREAVDVAIQALEAQNTTGDTIYKQAVLDVLNKLDVSDGVGISSIACYVQESAIAAIQQLPPAPPPKTCVAEIKVEIDDLKDYIDKTINAERWIPCNKRLPKEEKKIYWVCTDTEHQCECRWTNNRFGIGEGEWGWSIFDTPQYTKVIAWKPLPEPWKEEQE